MADSTGAVVDILADTAKTAISSWTTWASTTMDRPTTEWTADASAVELARVTRLAVGSAVGLAIGLMNAISTQAAADDPMRPSSGQSQRTGSSEVQLRPCPLLNEWNDELPADRVTIAPNALKQGEHEFTVLADGTGYPTGLYEGVVEVISEGRVCEEVPVSVGIP